jgi:hypothetical protein
MVVLASAASVLFALTPVQPAVNCYAPQDWSRVGVAPAIGCGFLALAGWLAILWIGRSHPPPIGACCAGFLTIVIVFALPAVLNTGAYTADADAMRDACGLTSPITFLIGSTAFTALFTIAIASVVIRLLPSTRWSFAIAGTSGVLTWVAYLLLLRPL